MLVLKDTLERLGVKIVTNKISSLVDIHICNSVWFDAKNFQEKSSEYPIRMIHRIDGPVGLYKGTDMSEDDKIYDLNSKFASATVYQSGYCFRRLCELGYTAVSPVVIPNSVDSSIFHLHGRVSFPESRKIRLISSAWSDNPYKGGPFYKWLDNHLDWEKYEYTFVGRVKEKFSHIHHIPPQTSESLATLLREHDIYIIASQHDPCSNALIEALSCGLPALHLNDGGHPELVGFGGLPFEGHDDILSQLDRIVEHYEKFQSLICIKSMEEVAQQYIDLARKILEQDS